MSMKNIIIGILITGLMSFLFVSCVKLDEDPRSQISTDNFYETESDAIAAVQSIYNDLTHNTSGDHASIYNRLLVLATGMMTDDHIPGTRATNPDVRSIGALTQTSTNTRYYELWRQHYEAINRANAAIERLPGITSVDTAVINRLVREAKFLRGLFYYNLVRLWGDVPLILHETTTLKDLNVARTPVDEVYTQIIRDFTDALNLPKKHTGSDGFRATSGAARSLLLSVYITRQEWSKAIEQYNAIANGGYGYDLFEKYGDNFVTSKENSVEHIFDAYTIADGSTSLNGTGNTNILSYISAPVTKYEVGQSYGGDADAPIVTLRQWFKPNDARTAVTFKDSILNSAGTAKVYSPHFYKYWDASASSNLANNGVNIPIIRFAEVILFYAEAENELNDVPNTEAYTAINRVRKRAGLDKLTEGLTKAQFRDSLFHERKLEFVYEQIRWFDLIRTNGSGTPLLVQTLKDLINPAKGGNATDTWTVAKAANVSDKFLLLPIPASEISANSNLKPQNPNW
jgi:starch-binding outer membrane protein, SusD/RagB family